MESNPFLIKVIPVNDAPVIIGGRPYTLVVGEDTELSVDLNEHFFDVDSDLAFTAISDNSNIEAIIENAQLTVRPEADYHGFGNVTVRANDSEYNIEKIFSVAIRSINDPPVIIGDEQESVTTNEDTEITVDLNGKFYDLDSSLTFGAVSNNQNIEGIINGTALLVRPAENYYGSGLITVTASDGEYSVEKKFGVLVRPGNDAPILTSIPDQSIDEDTAPPADLINLCNHARDVEDNCSNLNFSIAEQTNPGLINCYIHRGKYLNCHQPRVDANGYSNITVTVTDTAGLTASDSFRMAVNPKNDCPARIGYSPENVTLEEDVIKRINLTGHFSDVDSTPTYEITATGEHLAAAIEGNELAVTPEENYNCGYYPRYTCPAVTISASDGECNATKSLVMRIAPVNDPPEAINLEVARIVLDEDTTTTIACQNRFRDIDSNLSCTYSSDNPSIEVDNRGTIKPAADYNGQGNITVVDSDGEYEASKTLEVIVSPVNDAPRFSSSWYLVDINNGEEGILDLSSEVSDVEGNPIFISLEAQEYCTTSVEELVVTVTPDYQQNYGTFDILASDGTAERRTWAHLRIAGPFGCLKEGSFSLSEGVYTGRADGRYWATRVVSGETNEPLTVSNGNKLTLDLGSIVGLNNSCVSGSDGGSCNWGAYLGLLKEDLPFSNSTDHFNYFRFTGSHFETGSLTLPEGNYRVYIIIPDGGSNQYCAGNLHSDNFGFYTINLKKE